MTDETLDFPGIFQGIREGSHLPESVVLSLMQTLKDILYDEPNVLELRAPITVCGDIHGQLYDLFELFDVSGELTDGSSLEYLFMGDYIDRGYFSLETFCFLTALKIKYPSRIYLLRGNHESRAINQMYGFYNDCVQIYGHAGVWRVCNSLFDLLPVAAVIDQKVFCVHGGLSKSIDFLEQLEILYRRNELPTDGPLCDICWSDPEEEIQEWQMNQRGAGWLFGAEQTARFERLNGLTLIARSHQVAFEGFQWFFGRKLVTVWSAPNYMYRVGNKACVMKLDAHLVPEMRMFDARADGARKKPDDIVSTYFL
jgi:diadenosine tetraphosphatase ApaH/serine/threonine PP2A family protein phosphatase